MQGTWANLDWVFQGIGAVLVALAMLVAAWALFWDRSRGRRRCPGCWYAMEGVPPGAGGAFTCPECGRVATGERRLLRTRRRWTWLSVAIALALLAGVSFRVPAFRAGGWPGAMPTTVLVFWPHDMGALTDELFMFTPARPPGPLAMELVDRAQAGELAGWQASVLTRRVLAEAERQGRRGVEPGARAAHEKLSRAVMAVRDTYLTLGEFAAAVESASGVPVRVDRSAIVGMGADPDRRVSVLARGRAWDVLRNGMERFAWELDASDVDWAVGESGVEIPNLTLGAGPVRVEAYDIAAIVERMARSWEDFETWDPAKKPEFARDMAFIVMLGVMPEDWVSHGGIKASMQPIGTKSLLVAAPTTTHFEIESALACLGGPGPISASPESMAVLETLARLDRVRLRFDESSMTVEAAAARVAEAAGVDVWFDRESLWGGTAEVAIDTETWLMTGSQALDRIALAMTRQHGDATWSVDEAGVYFTTSERAGWSRMRAVYDVGDLLPLSEAEPMEPAQSEETSGMLETPDVVRLAWRVMEDVDPEGWTHTGGERGECVPMWDRLVIVATPRNHAAIRLLLDDLRRKQEKQERREKHQPKEVTDPSELFGWPG